MMLAGFAASATCALARGWIRPVDGPVTRAFSVSADRFAAGQHRGVDLAAAPGAPVRAACDGRVSFAGRVPRGGRTVSVRCGSLVATHQHLGSMAVARGQVVTAGAPIGRSGRARQRPHVHLGARVAATGEYRAPARAVRGRAARTACTAAPRAALAARRSRAAAAAAGAGAGCSACARPAPPAGATWLRAGAGRRDRPDAVGGVARARTRGARPAARRRACRRAAPRAHRRRRGRREGRGSRACSLSGR